MVFGVGEADASEGALGWGAPRKRALGANANVGTNALIQGGCLAMNARPRPAVLEAVASQTETVCIACQSDELRCCRSLLAADCNVALTEMPPFDESYCTVSARRIICDEQDLYDAVPIICSGWAALVAPLPDGNRQILSILLPGDFVSTALLFDRSLHCRVEAITEVNFRTFKRSELKPFLFRHPHLFEKFAKAWVEEKDRADQLVVDLGRRMASARIARLIWNLAERLVSRGMMASTGPGRALEMEFPLRQHHIADATGLTPVHVSKNMTDFRRDGLIAMNDRTLTILDPAGLRRVADSS